MFLFLVFIDRDACVVTNQRTTGTPDTVFGMLIAAVRVTFVVHFAYGERQRLCGTGHDAEVAPLAAGFVNDDGSNNFAHLCF